MDYWIWAILFLALGICLAILEVFFPSAGILGFLAAVSLLSAIVTGFFQGAITGLIILICVVIGLPVVLVLAFKYWPQTAMGRRILLGPPAKEEVLPDDPEKEFLKSLIGRVGKAKSKLLLSGVISIDGRTIDAVSESLPVEAGEPVVVVRVEGRVVVVRPAEKQDLPADQAPSDPLQQSYDSVFDLEDKQP